MVLQAFKGERATILARRYAIGVDYARNIIAGRLRPDVRRRALAHWQKYFPHDMPGDGYERQRKEWRAKYMKVSLQK